MNGGFTTSPNRLESLRADAVLRSILAALGASLLMELAMPHYRKAEDSKCEYDSGGFGHIHAA